MLVSALVAMMAGAIALSVAVAVDDVLGGELRVLRELQTWSFLGGWFADAVRFVTTTQVVTVCGAVAVVALWLVGERRAAVALGVAVIVLQVLQPSIKEIVDRPRPADDVVDIRGSITSPSFPAGHVMSPTALYGFLAGLALLRPAWPPALRAAILLLTVALLVVSGLVNLYLGVHWPTDVLGGWLWGGAVAAGGLLLMRAVPDWPVPVGNARER